MKKRKGGDRCPLHERERESVCACMHNCFASKTSIWSFSKKIIISKCCRIGYNCAQWPGLLGRWYFVIDTTIYLFNKEGEGYLCKLVKAITLPLSFYFYLFNSFYCCFLCTLFCCWLLALPILSFCICIIILNVKAFACVQKKNWYWKLSG